MSEAPQNQNRWLTTQEAAEYLSISATTLVRWRSIGKGPKFSRPGPRLIRYDIEDLQEFMESAAEDDSDAA